MITILRDLFGPGTWGTGGNMVAWVICGAIGGVWLRRKLITHHAQVLAQAAQHHRESMAQAQAHHEDMKRHVAAVAESQVSGGSTPFDSRERLDGPPAISQAEFVRIHGGSGPDAVRRAFGGRM